MPARNNLQYLMTLIHLRRDITLSGQTGVMQDMKASVGDGVCTGFRNTVNELFTKRIEAIQEKLTCLAKGCYLVSADIAKGVQPDGASHLDAGEEKLQDMADIVDELAELLDIELTWRPVQQLMETNISPEVKQTLDEEARIKREGTTS